MTTAKDLVDVLTRHYTGGPGHRDADSHAIYTELPAPGDTRRADLVAVSLWGSRGYGIDVHEIKVSRADWLAELKQPSKAEAWWPHSSRFWLVVPHESIVAPGELPEGWGLMVPPKHAGRRSMQKLVKPAVRTPQIPLELVARVLTREQRNAASQAEKARWEGNREGVEQERRSAADHGTDRMLLTPHQRTRLDHLKRIEQMFGGELGWLEDDIDANEAARALKFIKDNRRLPTEWELSAAEQAGQRILDAAAAMRAALKPLAEPKTGRAS